MKTRPGFCKVATLQDIKDNDYVLTPGRYVGAAEQEEDGVAFETKMRELSKTLFEQMKPGGRTGSCDSPESGGAGLWGVMLLQQ